MRGYKNWAQPFFIVGLKHIVLALPIDHELINVIFPEAFLPNVVGIFFQDNDFDWDSAFCFSAQRMKQVGAWYNKQTYLRCVTEL